MENVRLEFPRAILGLALAVTVATLAVYLPAVCPTLYWFDSAEFVNTARLLDVPHPPGYALYNLLAAIAVRVPLGEVPQRVNALSAIFSALALGLCFLVVWMHTRRALAALLAAGILGTAPRFVEMSLVAEVYPLEIFLYMACFLQLAAPAKRPTVLYVLLSLLVTHRLTNVFFAIGAIYLAGPERLRTRDALWLGIGALPYLHTAYVFFLRPVPEHGLWAINYFDYPRTAETFLRVITGTLYASHLRPPSMSREVEEMEDLLRFLDGQAGTIVVALGLLALCRKGPAELKLAALANALFFMHYDVLEKDTMYFPAFAGIVMLGILQAHRILEEPRIPAWVGSVTWITALLVTGQRGLVVLERMQRSDLSSVERVVEGARVQLPPRTLFMVTDDQLLHPMVSLILVEKKRPDLGLHIVEGYGPAVKDALRAAIARGVPVMSPLFLSREEMAHVRRDFTVIPEGPYYHLATQAPALPRVEGPAYPTLWGETLRSRVASSHQPLRAGDHIRVRVTMEPAVPRVLVFRLAAGRRALHWVFPSGYQGRPPAADGSSTEDYLLTLPPEVMSWPAGSKETRLELGLLPSTESAAERGYIAIEPAPEAESEIFKGRAGASIEALEQGTPFHEPIYRYRRGELAYSELVPLELLAGPR